MEKGNKIYIKGMVCQRCISTVKNEFEAAGLEVEEIHLGEVIFSSNIELPDATFFEKLLAPLGLSLLEDRKLRLIKEIKSLVSKVYNGQFDFPNRFRFSELVSQELGKDYDSISMIFSIAENMTLEKYIIEYRIEKIKEFLAYSEDTLADISFKLGFSSVAHLSRQFKQQTGMTPSFFKQLRNKE
jgi:AraC family transcriptional regulator